MRGKFQLDSNLAKPPAGGLKLRAEDKVARLAFLNTLTDREFIRPPMGRGGGDAGVRRGIAALLGARS